MIQARGRYVPDYRRRKSANEPRLREPVPALQRPIENANTNLVKSIVTLNRAGSHRGNPILKGLGIRSQYVIDPADRFRGLFLFQDRGLMGGNLIRQASNSGEVATFDFVAGSGQSKAGNPGDPAVRNFIEWQSKAGGAAKEFWLKNYDADVVTLNGEAVLDPVTFLPVEVVVKIVDDSLTWIDVPADFMPSWNDEFQVLHRRTDGDVESGFLKSYGGALVVSFFDSTPGTEGVGVAVNPITQQTIYTQRKIQVQNTAGLKEFKARFRSKVGSPYFVDVPIKVRVLAGPEENCLTPADEPCGEMLLKKGTPLPENLPSVASTPGVQVVAGTPAVPLARDLFYVSMHSAIGGASANLIVRKYKAIADTATLAGFRYEKIGTDLEFKPLRFSHATPAPGGEYQPAQSLVIAFDVLNDRGQNVAAYAIAVKDGVNLSAPQLFQGPSARDPMFFPAGDLGGVHECFY
jgi:hypothetical protein